MARILLTNFFNSICGMVLEKLSEDVLVFGAMLKKHVGTWHDGACKRHRKEGENLPLQVQG